MITQLPGESRWESICSHFSLDTMEEDQFLIYIKGMGYTIDADDDIIEHLHEMWDENINK